MLLTPFGYYQTVKIVSFINLQLFVIYNLKNIHIICKKNYKYLFYISIYKIYQ